MQKVHRKKVKAMLLISAVEYLVAANLLFPFEAQQGYLQHQY